MLLHLKGLDDSRISLYFILNSSRKNSILGLQIFTDSVYKPINYSLGEGI